MSGKPRKILIKVTNDGLSKIITFSLEGESIKKEKLQSSIDKKNEATTTL
jgi:hypothetical protein